MIRIIAGGKKNAPWCEMACEEYEKRLRKPFDLHFEFIEEEKLLKKLTDWPFTGREFVICCDERGKNISSKADFVWGFSKLVFPHMIARLIVTEQIYRAQEIARGGKYHHE